MCLALYRCRNHPQTSPDRCRNHPQIDSLIPRMKVPNPAPCIYYDLAVVAGIGTQANVNHTVVVLFSNQLGVLLFPFLTGGFRFPLSLQFLPPLLLCFACLLFFLGYFVPVLRAEVVGNVRFGRSRRESIPRSLPFTAMLNTACVGDASSLCVVRLYSQTAVSSSINKAV